ncbi:hypothetical protein NDU88_001030 [Pleurodeles waltl]|uniref:Secreted protein n=1 Tax=Pleurodeles waltl TaxID=8319 RepID=A0AAV7VY89_PLEWA|nr:hypothetical protein NDU88_001030 [Pleurodeles waltl]
MLAVVVVELAVTVPINVVEMAATVISNAEETLLTNDGTELNVLVDAATERKRCEKGFTFRAKETVVRFFSASASCSREWDREDVLILGV